ncbi:MAG: HAD-IC family P-type ATPase [Candidatus Kapabacteria bacterium]|nr:HAD-IC family P-type ATPase [Candidatus Kapabacteria bacterium]
MQKFNTRCCCRRLEAEAQARTYLSVVSPTPANRSLRSIILSNTFTPFNALNVVLLAALAAVYIWKQDVRFLLDAVGVVLSVISNNILAVAQEVRAHRAVERAARALRHTVMVERNGQRLTADSDEVVVGDTVVLAPGSILPGDGNVVTSAALEIDTSMLTGEAAPHACGVGDALMAGSVCVAGSGSVRVTSAGADTAAAHIAQSASHLSLATSPMQRRINRLFEASFVLAVAIAVIDLVFRLQRHDLDADAIRQTAAIVLGLIPEGLVLFSTVTFALCVARVAKVGVFAQHLSSIEHLASVTDVCFDKTGTLTERRTSVAAIVPLADLSQQQLASTLRAFAVGMDDAQPTMRALQELHVDHAETLNIVDRIPFTSQRRFSAVREGSGDWYVLGSGHVLAPGVKIPAAHSTDRVVMFGRASSIDGMQASFRPLCWVVLDDTMRDDAARLLRDLDASHIDVHVLTGDAPESALRVLSRVGRLDSAGVLLPRTYLKARMFPSDKQVYVSALQDGGHHVAFVGDGINDIPALREAHVGIAAPDAAPVAQHVADIVLDAASIGVLPSLIYEGRITMRTIMHIAKIFLAKNAVLLIAALLAAASWTPAMLTPRRGGLIAILAVAIPSTVLAARSRSDTAVRSAYREIARYCGLTSLAAALSVLATGTLPSATGITAFTTYSALLASVLASLPYVDTHAPTRRMIARFATGAAALFLGVLLAPSLPPVEWVRVFFEMDTMQGAALQDVLLGMTLSALITTGIHSTAARWQKR